MEEYITDDGKRINESKNIHNRRRGAHNGRVEGHNRRRRAHNGRGDIVKRLAARA